MILNFFLDHVDSLKKAERERKLKRLEEIKLDIETAKKHKADMLLAEQNEDKRIHEEYIMMQKKEKEEENNLQYVSLKNYDELWNIWISCI